MYADVSGLYTMQGFRLNTEMDDSARILVTVARNATARFLQQDLPS